MEHYFAGLAGHLRVPLAGAADMHEPIPGNAGKRQQGHANSAPLAAKHLQLLGKF
jgi:hypothetical protein